MSIHAQGCVCESVREYLRIGEKVVKQSRQRGHCLLRKSESQPCGREIERGRGLLLACLVACELGLCFLGGVICFSSLRNNKSRIKNQIKTQSVIVPDCQGDPTTAQEVFGFWLAFNFFELHCLNS